MPVTGPWTKANASSLHSYPSEAWDPTGVASQELSETMIIGHHWKSNIRSSSSSLSSWFYQYWRQQQQYNRRRRVITTHYSDVKMGTIASQITSLTIVFSTIYSDADQRKHQSSASLAFLWGIHWGPVNSPHKWPVTRKNFPFDDVIMDYFHHQDPTRITSNLEQILKYSSQV